MLDFLLSLFFFFFAICFSAILHPPFTIPHIELLADYFYPVIERNHSEINRLNIPRYYSSTCLAELRKVIGLQSLIVARFYFVKGRELFWLIRCSLLPTVGHKSFIILYS